MTLQQMIQVYLIESRLPESWKSTELKVTLTQSELEHYTQLVIFHACIEAIKLKGRSLDD